MIHLDDINDIKRVFRGKKSNLKQGRGDTTRRTHTHNWTQERSCLHINHRNTRHFPTAACGVGGSARRHCAFSVSQESHSAAKHYYFLLTCFKKSLSKLPAPFPPPSSQVRSPVAAELLPATSSCLRAPPSCVQTARVLGRVFSALVGR